MTVTEQGGNPMHEEKVLTLNTTGAHESSWRPQSKRRIVLWLSFLFCVILPLLTVSCYYLSIATDRYAARAGFSIRGIDTSSGIDGIGALTGLASSGSTTSDSYIVLGYLESRELLEAVDTELDLHGMYSSSEVDIISRLAPDVTVEGFLRYWVRHIQTQFDPTTGIIEFEVQSFNDEHAQNIADTVLSLTQTFVNDISANARSDALRFAREEVQLQEARLRQSLATIREFRSSEQSVDPLASASLDIELIASLESRLIDVNARISVLRATLNEDAPTLAALIRNADALAEQIVDRREAIGSDMSNESGLSAVTQQLAQYEELEVERSLAQQAYASALSSLEQARRDADRQQRYLAVHLRPQVAEEAMYPLGLRNILILSFALVSAWGIGTLMTYSVRDHLT